MFWVEAVRVVVILTCAMSLVCMSVIFYKERSKMNKRARDYWYGRMAWCVLGVSGGVEGLIRHTPFRYSLMILLVASLVTLKANLQKGKWGNH